MKTTNENRIQPWNITQLAREMQGDLSQCQNQFERSNCLGIYAAEIRTLRDTIKASGRKFTPGEEAVMLDMSISF